MSLDSKATIKTVAIVVLFTVSLLIYLSFVLFPRLMRQPLRRYPKCTKILRSILSFAMSFSGGIFITIGLLHILSEAAEMLEKELSEDVLERYRPAYSSAVLGYLVILFLDRALNPESVTAAMTDDTVRSDDMETQPAHGTNPEDETVVVAAPKGSVGTENLVSLPGLLSLSVALLVHVVIVGISLGIQSETDSTATIFFAILVHFWADDFSLGMIASRSVAGPVLRIVIGVCIATGRVLGIAIGWGAKRSFSPLAQGFLLSIAAGSFIYLGCTEVIPEEMRYKGRSTALLPKNPRLNILLRYLSTFLGCVFIFGCTALFVEH